MRVRLTRTGVAIVSLVALGITAGLIWNQRSSSAYFDTYLVRDTLLYVKQPCNPADVQAPFFLHVYPVDRMILPEHRRQFAFDNLDFEFSQYGSMANGKCAVAVPLPSYKMSSIKTGQFIRNQKISPRLWEKELVPGAELVPGEETRPGPALPRRLTPKAGHPWTIKTSLYVLQLDPIELEPFLGWGGAIEALGDDLLVATTRGRLALVSSNGTVNYLDGKVPMNETGLESYDNPKFDPARFRIGDILLKQHLSGRFELFVSHHYFNGECFLLRLSSTMLFREAGSIRVSPDWRPVFDAEPCLKPPFSGEVIGGKMVTDGPEHLLVITGDFGREGREPLSQDPGSHLGKLVRVNTRTGHADILTSGHRNPQGLTRDRNGTLWALEHGPMGGDELNRLETGGNYGWPYVSYGIRYNGRKLNDSSEVAQHEGYTKPVFAWAPSIGSSSLVVNDPREFPLWHDDLLVGSIVGSSSGDIEGRSLFRIRRHGVNVQYVERIKIGRRVRDMAYLSDGRLGLLSGNWVLLVSRSDEYCNEESDWQRDVYALHCGSIVDEAAVSASETGGQAMTAPSAARLFTSHCSKCHSLAENKHTAGPHLVDVLDRRAGEIDGYHNFSSAFRALDLVWTRENLQQFLVAPQRLVPGTSMVTPGISEAEARLIVDFISSQGASKN